MELSESVYALDSIWIEHKDEKKRMHVGYFERNEETWRPFVMA
jgi:hypothetical protein